MGTGIIVCGLNGAGKSTFGRALAQALSLHFIDIEDLYFPKDDPRYLYASPRSEAEVRERLLQDIRSHEDFVLASVRGDLGEEICRSFRYAILMEVPRELRLARIRARSFDKFGDRMLPGGDLYEQEERFFELAASRSEDTVEKWVRTLSCPILRIDGAKPVSVNIEYVTKQTDLSG